MDIRLDTTCTLSTEHQAIVDAFNRFLARLPGDEDPRVALRLALEILEVAGVAPRIVLAQAVGLVEDGFLPGGAGKEGGAAGV